MWEQSKSAGATPNEGELHETTPELVTPTGPKLYAVDPDGRLLHINQIANGLIRHIARTEYQEPHTGAKLCAKAKAKTPHFAYWHGTGKSSEERTEVASNSESVLHLASKDLIKELGELRIKAEIEGVQQIVKIEFERLQLEERFEDGRSWCRVDTVGTIQAPECLKAAWEGLCLIEIWASHQVPEDKRKLLQSLPYGALEIKLPTAMVTELLKRERDAITRSEDLEDLRNEARGRLRSFFENGVFVRFIAGKHDFLNWLSTLQRPEWEKEGYLFDKGEPNDCHEIRERYKRESKKPQSDPQQRFLDFDAEFKSPPANNDGPAPAKDPVSVVTSEKSIEDVASPQSDAMILWDRVVSLARGVVKFLKEI